MKYPWFFCHRDNMWLDSWTYGDWRQYVCKRGKTTQCAKLSAAPVWIGLIGFVMLMMGLTGFFMVWGGVSPESLYMGRVIGFTIAGLFLIVITLPSYFTGWRLMKAVGPMNFEGRRVLTSDLL